MIDVLIAVILDLIIGDPYSFPHPIKLMGNVISFEEGIIRKFSKSEKQLEVGGALIAVGNIVFVFLFNYLLMLLTQGWVHRVLKIYLIYTSLSAKMLAVEATKVKEKLKSSLIEARKQLSWIVGRDTEELSQEEIIKATVETVSENTSDGVIAPLFYLLLFSVPGAMTYKMVNTMDSMLGYRDEKYLHIGKWPALIDDVFNYLPARLTAFFMLISSVNIETMRKAAKIVKRDHKNHLSPNAGYPESAAAGLLGIQLGGGHNYFGRYIYKPTIGDDTRSPEIKDIERVNQILYRTLGAAIIFYFVIDLIRMKI